ncbi:hypothetical protein H0H92_009911 [Tricholoma furcatifolium]|nr:hypothetical protein H0H92_009911 [Tricholoma furcatifolium]
MLRLSKWRKSLSLSRSTNSDIDSTEDLTTNNDPPTISQLYGEAVEFEKVLAKSGCIECPIRRSHKDGCNGFADLVGHDLSQCEQATADHCNKLSVARYCTRDTEAAYEDFKSCVESNGPPAPIIHRAGDEDEPWDLDPQKIVALLVDEFGPLVAEDEEEKLLLETDGCLIQDVFIIGVIHVTTHRVAFHASLFESKPDKPISERIIKNGPAILHRKGWHANRRVWLELSHDMICAYTSSNDEGRIRPLYTILFAFIKKVHPIDPRHPRTLHAELTERSRGFVDAFEFDTEESARDWRREIDGALFLYRHQRRAALDTSNTEEGSGIRLSLPLNRIAEIRFGCYPEFPCIASLALQPLPALPPDDNESVESETSSIEQETIRIGTIRATGPWQRLQARVECARRRLQQNPAGLYHSPIFIDFGPLTYHESQEITSESDLPWLKEVAIRGALALGSDEKNLWIAKARVYRNISSYGYFVLSTHFLGFWSKSNTPNDVKYRIPLNKIQNVKHFDISICLLHGLSINIKGRTPLKLVFKNSEARDDAQDKTLNALERVRFSTISTSPVDSGNSTPPISPSSALSPISPTDFTDASSDSQPPKHNSATTVLAPLSRSLKAAKAGGLPTAVQLRLPKAINLPREILTTMPSRHFVCLTIGSRGDVQPYIALGLGLMKEGHKVTIVTHEEYRDWIVGFGIGHRTAGGDPGALMKLSVENKFRPWLDELLLEAWSACYDADVLLESPSAMAGVHVAEALGTSYRPWPKSLKLKNPLGIPYFRTFTMPWTKTTEFPHAFLSPPVDSPAFNSASYVLFSNVMWTATSGQINRWRRHVLKLPNTDMGHLAQSKITTIYNFSQAVVPKPLDWGDTTIVSGYWFLDNPDLSWKPPQSMLDFIQQARTDGKPLVYIGFGSITVPNPNRVTERIAKAVVQSDVRAIVCKGWSSRMNKGSDENQVKIPPECYIIDKVPHDWLFPQVDAALHHGGAGTTGASLRAGIPTLIKPWFGDQFFWGARVHRLGAGLRVPSLRVSDLVHALTKATSSP